MQLQSAKPARNQYQRQPENNSGSVVLIPQGNFTGGGILQSDRPETSKLPQQNSSNFAQHMVREGETYCRQSDFVMSKQFWQLNQPTVKKVSSKILSL